jgi:hypothetical protein
MFLSAVCVKYCPTKGIVECKHNSLFKKDGTCSNYLDAKKSTYTAPYISTPLFGYCIPHAAC